MEGASNQVTKPEVTPDLAAIERLWRTGQLSNREIGRQHGVSEAWVRKLAKTKGWARDLSGAVRARVRESLVREGVRANQLAGVTPSDEAVVDEAAARGVEVVRSHRLDINALRQATAQLLDDVRSDLGLKVTDRARVIAELAMAMARLVPLERQAFGLDEDRPEDGVGIQISWPLPRTQLDE